MLTLQFIQYHEMSKLSSNQRINRIINEVRDSKIVLLEGRLRPEEETKLIQKTMEGIGSDFSGVELCTIYPEMANEKVFSKLKLMFANLLIGDRSGMTLVGPASVIKEIRRDPNKIQLLTTNAKKRASRRR